MELSNKDEREKKAKRQKALFETGVMHLATEEELGAATLPPQQRGGNMRVASC